jgi:hypothetical protein
MVGDMILIDPYGVGKTEMANLLFVRMKLPSYSLDRHQLLYDYDKECDGYIRGDDQLWPGDHR